MGSTLQHFIADTFETRPRAKAQSEVFETVHNRRFLKVTLGGGGMGAPTRVWVKASCLAANRGGVILERNPDAPGSDLMLASSATGAHIFLSSERCHVVLLRLGRPGPSPGPGSGNTEALFVNMDSLLAFEPTVRHTVNQAPLHRPGGTIMATVKVAFLQGSGYVALLAQGPPMTVAIDPGLPPLCSNPLATIGWSSNVVFPHLTPKPGFLEAAAANTKKVSDGTFQLNFSHTSDNARGYVILQPVEETTRNILPDILKGFRFASCIVFRILRCVVAPGVP